MLARITATIMGRMWEIWPVSSKQITAVDTVWVTAPVSAAAPGREEGEEQGKGGGREKWKTEEGREGWVDREKERKQAFAGGRDVKMDDP